MKFLIEVVHDDKNWILRTKEHTVRDMILYMSRTIPYAEDSSISDGLFSDIDTLCRNVRQFLIIACRVYTLFINGFLEFL